MECSHDFQTLRIQTTKRVRRGIDIRFASLTATFVFVVLTSEAPSSVNRVHGTTRKAVPDFQPFVANKVVALRLTSKVFGFC